MPPPAPGFGTRRLLILGILALFNQKRRRSTTAPASFCDGIGSRQRCRAAWGVKGRLRATRADEEAAPSVAVLCVACRGFLLEGMGSDTGWRATRCSCTALSRRLVGYLRNRLRYRSPHVFSATTRGLSSAIARPPVPAARGPCREPALPPSSSLGLASFRSVLGVLVSVPFCRRVGRTASSRATGASTSTSATTPTKNGRRWERQRG